MKLGTNKGNVIARREGARDRFSIMKYHKFCIERDLVDDEQAQEEYEGYKNRKKNEAKSLGILNNYSE